MSMPPAEIGPGEFFPVVGVGPHPKPWPVGEEFDLELLENGDRRNVLDKYRYWSVTAIVGEKLGLHRVRPPGYGGGTQAIRGGDDKNIV